MLPRDFPVGPVAKTFPCRECGFELRCHIPRSQKTKQNRKKQIVTNSIKSLKMVHIKKQS